ncbi:Release factor glutamine methyltransferase [Usitatibacter rugosus]|uniref:Release factor glutamine methyltransferase n=1 Tax=Usitatibacter rugosus TaxID=2732067 RepID=A0A6M4GW28_9PROT|nr:class I SAM-dependent methyltransferase [Usitatibacter rugosus]QJR11232.1 Release factor glutamine methyltransferase [Usitatibacter rugosus]
MGDALVVDWSEDGQERSAAWRSERGAPPPEQLAIVDDRITADEAYGLACQGIALLWRGDFQNARQMLTALAHRADKPPRKAAKPGKPKAPADAFNLARQARAQRARTLGMLLIPLEADFAIPLRRAPDIREACLEAYGSATQEASVVSLRELLGVIGAHEWRRRGIELHGMKIHPHYGVFAPVRSEYVDLVAKMSFPPVAATHSVAFDIGTGTGVIAAVLAKRGMQRVVATDLDPRALACARENVQRLGFGANVDVVQADLFPEGRAAVVVCNPPWVPARPSSPLEHGIYDPESRMLKGFLGGLPSHLEDGGEGWLILSDLAEHLGLRKREDLLALFEAAGLKAIDRMDIRPKHPKASDANDPLHAARKLEVTSLWRLVPKTPGV